MVIGLVYAVAAYSQNCLYCKRVDSKSAFLYSYSYCAKNNLCLQDQWNYINQWCSTKWINGWMIDIDSDCAADEAVGACQDFTSEEAYYGTYFNSTRFLKAGQKCTISIDASAAVARVIFDDVTNLGVLFNGYEIGKAITIPQGEKQSITVYNGNQLDIPLAFQLSFSGATNLIMGASVIVGGLCLLSL